MNIEALKSSIGKILMIWGVVFWIGGIGYMIYSSTNLFMWVVMTLVLIVPILILYFISNMKKAK